MSLFRFKEFVINQSDCAMKVGTDAMVLGAWTDPGFVPETILDAGTGTGVLALMMAQRFPRASVHTIERDEAAFRQSLENFRTNVLGQHVQSVLGDYLHYPFSTKYDLIITNPPYFEQSTPAQGEARHAARHAVGFSVLDWLNRSTALLTERGVVAVILPADVMNHVIENSRKAHPIQILEVHGKIDQHNRSCVLFGKESGQPPVVNQLVIRHSDGTYTSDYIMLTREFHGVTL